MEKNKLKFKILVASNKSLVIFCSKKLNTSIDTITLKEICDDILQNNLKINCMYKVKGKLKYEKDMFNNKTDYKIFKINSVDLIED